MKITPYRQLQAKILRQTQQMRGLIRRLVTASHLYAPAACLHKCRTPIGFLLTDWRSGPGGAFRMGLKHGQYCIGCCWALMMVLFVGGVMSLTTIAVLSGIVAIEKLAPRGEQISRLGGLLLIAWGLWVIASANIGQTPAA